MRAHEGRGNSDHSFAAFPSGLPQTPLAPPSPASGPLHPAGDHHGLAMRPARQARRLIGSHAEVRVAKVILSGPAERDARKHIVRLGNGEARNALVLDARHECVDAEIGVTSRNGTITYVKARQPLILRREPAEAADSPPWPSAYWYDRCSGRSNRLPKYLTVVNLNANRYHSYNPSV